MPGLTLGVVVVCPPPHDDINIVSASATVIAIAWACGNRCFGHHKSTLMTAMNPTAKPVRANGSYLVPEGPIRKGGRIPLLAAVAAAVAIDTVKGVDDVPFSETAFGDTLHTDGVAAPLHVSATV